MQSKVPEDLRQRVQDAYAAICQLDEGVNPIKKVPIVVYCIEDQLMIDGAASNTQQPGQQGGNGPQENQQVLFAQIQGLRQEVNELHDTMQTNDSSL